MVRKKVTRRVRLSPECLWIQTVNNATTETQHDYEMNQSYAENDCITHPVFGLGVVTSTAPKTHDGHL